MRHVSYKGGADVWIGSSRPAVLAAFVRDYPGCLLRSVGGVMAANIMRVQCNSNLPISLASAIQRVNLEGDLVSHWG
jgi:hypothetical protein